jgi:hypothetical protein
MFVVRKLPGIVYIVRQELSGYIITLLHSHKGGTIFGDESFGELHARSAGFGYDTGYDGLHWLGL